VNINLTFSRRHLVALVSILGVVLLARAAYAEADHRTTVKERHASQLAAAQKRSARQLDVLRAKLTAEKNTAVKTAADTQRRHDQRMLKRVIKKMKVSRRKAAKQAREQGTSAGYASGQSAGYASGKNDGYSQGSSDTFAFCWYDDGYIC
jgi:hypothetical protein